MFLTFLTIFFFFFFCMGQLAKLSYCITFDYSRCTVLDPRMRQELGTSPRVGHMFSMNNLRLSPIAPIAIAIAATVISSIPSLALWHDQLDHAYSFRVQHLTSRGFF